MTTLHTASLLLRPPVAADAEAIATLSCDWEVARMTARLPFPNSEASVRTFLAGLDPTQETVFAGFENGVLAGLASYHGNDLGYWIGRAHWGRGLATEMARAVVHHAFTVAGLAELKTCHFADNPASGRVIEKCGFEPTGRCSTFSVARNESVPSLTFRLTRARAEAAPWFATAVREGP